MRKASIITAIIISLSLIITGVIVEAKKTGKAQTICPVMGDPINKKFFVDYKGYRVYFCCSSCPEEFKKNPEKYMKKLRDSGVAPEKAPAADKGGTTIKETGGQTKHKHHGE
ncbi:MAG TPA: YHS domain-containing protein [Spirochaetota bacterium]|nr:YHS domain-containing protein [Spirochaetota bacterium]HPV40584.1 YHS domain-containing protein [Spirochaetota bacterium]